MKSLPLEKHFSPEKLQIIQKIIPVLSNEGCSLAVLFGSFVESEYFRDIDIMVALEHDCLSNADCVYFSQLLENATGIPFDVVQIDVPDILLRGEIGRKGIPVILADESAWDDFRFRAWIDEIDYRPLIERFYSERFNNKQRQDVAARIAS